VPADLRRQNGQRPRPVHRAEIQKQFKGEVQVVLKPELADAVMAGVSEHQTGTRAAVTGRWLGLA
jgi:hypothetical protein